MLMSASMILKANERFTAQKMKFFIKDFFSKRGLIQAVIVVCTDM